MESSYVNVLKLEDWKVLRNLEDRNMKVGSCKSGSWKPLKSREGSPPRLKTLLQNCSTTHFSLWKLLWLSWRRIPTPPSAPLNAVLWTEWSEASQKSCFKSAENRAVSSLWLGGHRYSSILCTSKLLWFESDFKLENLTFGEQIVLSLLVQQDVL